MTLDRPGEENPDTGQDAGRPGQTGSPTPPPQAPARDQEAAQRSRLSLRTRSGKRSSADKRRQRGHGLQVVSSTTVQPERPPGESDLTQQSSPGQGDQKPVAEPAHAPEPNEDPHVQAAARMMQAIEDEVEEIRRGAGRVIQFQTAAEPQRHGQQIGYMFSRLKSAVRRLAQEKPIPLLAGLFGLGFGLLAALRGRRSR